MALCMAQLRTEQAERNIAEVFKFWTGNVLPAHPRTQEPCSHHEPIDQELLVALKESREVLLECANDVIGTPTEEFFRLKVHCYDIVIARAEGRS